MKLGTGYDCQFDHFFGIDGCPNSNTASWRINNTFALWELLDSAASGADDGANDDFDGTLAALMTALYDNSVAAGSAGQNWKYEEFVYSGGGAPCLDNEDCGNGNSCMGDFAAVCYSGDTCGGNIGDLAHHLVALQAMYSWPGNIAATIKSSMCIKGDPDISYPFNGSYRDD